VVTVVTCTAPAATHAIANDTSVTAPTSIVDCGLTSLTVQLGANSSSTTAWMPGATETDTPLFTPTASSVVQK